MARTLTLIQKKMGKHLSRSERGPIPLPTLAGTEKGTKEYERSHLSSSHLQAIYDGLKLAIAEIDEYCRMRREWLRRVPRRDIAEKESLGLLMRSVKDRTGKCYHADLSKLLSIDVSKVAVTINNETVRLRPLRTSADALRKILKLRTPLLDQWNPKPETSEQNLPSNFR